MLKLFLGFFGPKIEELSCTLCSWWAPKSPTDLTLYPYPPPSIPQAPPHNTKAPTFPFPLNVIYHLLSHIIFTSWYEMCYRHKHQWMGLLSLVLKSLLQLALLASLDTFFVVFIFIIKNTVTLSKKFIFSLYLLCLNKCLIWSKLCMVEIYYEKKYFFIFFIFPWLHKSTVNC